MSTLALVGYANGISGSAAVDKPVFNTLYSESEGFMLAPKKHDSQDSIYGLGTTSYYGHVKLYDNINRNSYTSGEALSSYQGKVLNDKINTKANEQSPQLKWNIGPNSTIPVTLREGGSNDQRALLFDVNDTHTEVINYQGVVLNNLISSMYVYYFNDDDNLTNKTINISFYCKNGLLSGFLLGYYDNYFITINLNEATTNLDGTHVHYMRLYEGQYEESGYARKLVNAMVVKGEYENQYRLKLQYDIRVNVLDILFISGNVKIYSASSAAS